MSSIRFSIALLTATLILFSFIQCGGNSPDTVFYRGLKAMQERDPIGASLYFDDFIKKFPEDERVRDAHLLLVECYYMMGEFPSAREVLKDAKEKFDFDVWCDFKIGDTYFRQGDFDNAISKYEEIADSTSDIRITVDALSNLAKVHAARTHAASAEMVYDQIFQIADTKVENPTESVQYKLNALYGKAEVREASQEFKRAREVYSKALDIVKDGTGIVGIEGERQNAVLQWAHTWSQAGDFVSSATIYDRLLDNPYIQPQIKPELIYYKVESLKRLFEQDGEKTPEEISVLVHENMRLVNDYSNTQRALDARVNIAQLVKDSTPEMSEKYLSEAVSEYTKLIDEPPSPEQQIGAKILLADAYIRLEKYDKARQWISDIQQNHSDIPNAVRRAEGMLYYIREQEAKQQKENQQSASVEIKNGT